jgi:septal ring factor EnvC (AmiA/AmiB activator)
MRSGTGKFCRLLWAATALACWVPGCTGDPSAPDVWSLRRKHEQERARSEAVLWAERDRADAATRHGRALSQVREDLLEDLNRLQSELDETRSAARRARARREELETRVGHVHDRIRELEEDVRRDSYEIADLQDRKALLRREVLRLREDIKVLGAVDER